MAVSILDIAGNMQPGLELGFVKTVVEDGAVIQQFPFEKEPRLTHSYTKEGLLPSGSFRPLNDGYNVDEKTVYTRESIDLKPYGTEITIDRKVAKLDGAIGSTQGAQQIDAAFRGLAKDLKKNIFKGDAVGGLGFSGLEQVTDNGPASQSILYAGAANGAAFTTPAVLVEYMDLLISAVEGNPVLFADSTMLAKINGIAVNAGNEVLASKFRYDNIQMADGKTYRVGTWDGIPMFPVGTDSQRAKILGFNETQGNAQNCSSIYAVDFSFQGPKILADELQPEIFEIETTQGRTYQIDWLLSLLVSDPYSVARLKGIKES